MNQAEVIHAGWTHRDRTNLSLLDACQADVRDTLLLDVELTNFQSGSAAGGSGPSYSERKLSNHQRELQKSKRIGKEMFPDEDSGFLIDPKSSHCPKQRELSFTLSKTKRKQKNTSSPATVGSQSTSDGATSLTVTSVNRIPDQPPRSSAASSNPSLPHFGHLLQNITNTPPCLPQPNFHANLPPVSFTNQTQFQPPIMNLQTQQFPSTPIISHLLASIVTSNTSYPVSSSFQIQCPVPQAQMFSTTPTVSSSATGSQSNTFGSQWHSGMAPNRYQVVLLDPIVKKCYGCGNAFADKYRRSPYNLVLKHVDRRITGKDDETGRYCIRVIFLIHITT